MAVINLGEIPEMKEYIDAISYFRKIEHTNNSYELFGICLGKKSDAEVLYSCIKEI